MKKYEYKCVYILGGGERTTRILNEYGQQGWELVSTVLSGIISKGKLKIRLSINKIKRNKNGLPVLQKVWVGMLL